VTAPTTPGLYSGPYRVSEVALGSHVVLLPNEHWGGKKPYFRRLVLKFIPNTATLETNLISGAVDMISHLGLSLDQAVAFEQRAKRDDLPHTVHFRDGLFYEHIDLNLHNEVLADKAVRQALVYAIDRQALCDALFSGKQKPALHNVAPIDPWYTDDPDVIKVYRHSSRRARRLLDRAGWKTDDNGIRYKNGNPLRIKLMTTAGDQTREQVQVFLQNQWKQIGVDIVIENQPASVYFATTVRQAKYPGMAMYAWLSSPENNPRSVLHSASIPTADNAWSGQNSTKYSNPEMDRLIEELDREFDHEKRVAIAPQIPATYTDDVPVIPLYYRTYNAVTPRKLKGFKLPGHLESSANHVEHWHF